MRPVRVMGNEVPSRATLRIYPLNQPTVVSVVKNQPVLGPAAPTSHIRCRFALGYARNARVLCPFLVAGFMRTHATPVTEGATNRMRPQEGDDVSVVQPHAVHGVAYVNIGGRRTVDIRRNSAW